MNDSTGRRQPDRKRWEQQSIGQSETFSGGSSLASPSPAEPNMLATPGQTHPNISATFPVFSSRDSLSSGSTQQPGQTYLFNYVRSSSSSTHHQEHAVASNESTPGNSFSGAVTVGARNRQATHWQLEQQPATSHGSLSNATVTQPIHGSIHRSLKRDREAYEQRPQDERTSATTRALELRHTFNPYNQPPLNQVVASTPDSRSPTNTNTMISRESSSAPTTRASRCSIHIRQQPRAARAGPDGKDRRPVDPPPVVQLMMSGFDPDSAADIDEMKASYAVWCRLVSATPPYRDMSAVSGVGDDGREGLQRLLLGTKVAGPLHTKDDPDPPTMPQHPPERNARPSPPSTRFLPSTSPLLSQKTYGPTTPGTFFVFADISVRKAGEYRLQFDLMKMDPAYLIGGRNLPIIHTVMSDALRVVNAKDFDQVQASTPLVRGLLDRGAGFPLKLKKGTREGGRRRNADAEQSDSDEEQEEQREEDEGG